MARTFITGSTDGLGHLTASALIQQGHQVVLHARNKQRAKEATAKSPGAESILIADLSSIAETKQLAYELNTLGSFDIIIHNAGLYQVPGHELSVDGLPLILAVNSIAPYILTCLIQKPKRLIYLSSGMHLQGDPMLKGLKQDQPRASYSDSKLHDLILTKAVARKWTGTYANAVDPGWVPTKMGGKGAPDNLQQGFETQVWLAVSNELQALVSGKYFHHRQESRYLTEADDVEVQERFLAQCERIGGVKFPENHT